MKVQISRPIFLILALAAASLACNAVTSALSTPTVAPTLPPAVPVLPTAVELPTSTSGPGGNDSNVLLHDDFSDSNSGWGTGTDADSAVEYVNGGFEMTVYSTHYFVYSTPSDTAYQNVHIEATVENKSTEDLATFGLLCDQQAASEAYYYFGISPNGEYAINKAIDGKDDVTLTNKGEWKVSDLIQKNAKSYQIGADCGSGTLALYVDGKKVDSVQDDSYTKGALGVFAWSAKKQSGTSVVFHDFVVTSLP